MVPKEILHNMHFDDKPIFVRYLPDRIPVASLTVQNTLKLNASLILKSKILHIHNSAKGIYIIKTHLRI